MLLLDENISYRIIKELSDVYPGIQHVTDVLAVGVTDETVWETAKQFNLAIVTFDADYKDIVNLKGFPPKIIWLRFGNCSNAILSNTLQFYSDVIHAFLKDEQLSILEITLPKL